MQPPVAASSEDTAISAGLGLGGPGFSEPAFLFKWLKGTWDFFIPPGLATDFCRAWEAWQKQVTSGGKLGFPGRSDGKESACSVGDPGSIPEFRRSPGERHGNPLQYSCLEKPMDRGAWWATVHRVAKGQTWLKDQHFHFQGAKESVLLRTARQRFLADLRGVSTVPARTKVNWVQQTPSDVSQRLKWHQQKVQGTCSHLCGLQARGQPSLYPSLWMLADISRTLAISPLSPRGHKATLFLSDCKVSAQEAPGTGRCRLWKSKHISKPAQPRWDSNQDYVAGPDRHFIFFFCHQLVEVLWGKPIETEE